MMATATTTGTDGQLIEAFALHLRTQKDYSPRSIRSYLADLGQFSRYLNQSNPTVSLLAVTQATTLGYYCSLEPTCRSNTLRKKLAILRRFYRFCVETRRLSVNPLAEIPLPKFKKGEISFLETAEFETLLTGLNTETFVGCRDRAIIGLIGESGVTVQELKNLNLADLDFAARTLTVVSQRKKKGSPRRQLALTAHLHLILQAYLDQRAKHPGATDEQTALILDSNGQRISNRGIDRRIRRATQRAGLTRKASAQRLRHSFAVRQRRAGRSLTELRELLGLGDIAIVSRLYSGVS